MARPTPTSPRPDLLLGWMEGLADPTRLRLLRLLEREELGVMELADVLQLPQSTVSRHLKILGDGGWLVNRRQGTASLYRRSDAIADGARKLWKLARAETDAWATVEADERRLEARLRERREDAGHFFAGAAGEWDRVRTEAYGREFELAVLRTLPSPDWTIADLGCGTGAFTLELAKSGARVVGVDGSASMLRVARRVTRDFPNVELHEASLEALPIADGSCELALLVLVLSYVAELEPVVREAHRILAPGGRLVAVDAFPYDDEEFRRRLGQARPGIDVDVLTALLADVGFAEVGGGGPIASRSGRSGPDLFLARGTRPRRRS
jgi:SAM-dependent methyltransferase